MPAKAAHAVTSRLLRAALTHKGSCRWVGFVLVGLEGAEEVGSGVQGAAPDDAQAWEVQRQQHQLAAQRVALHPQPCTSMYTSQNPLGTMCVGACHRWLWQQKGRLAGWDNNTDAWSAVHGERWSSLKCSHWFWTRAPQHVQGPSTEQQCFTVCVGAHIDVAADLGCGMQGEGLVALKLDEQDGRLVVLGHDLRLVVQPPRQERLAQI